MQKTVIMILTCLTLGSVGWGTTAVAPSPVVQAAKRHTKSTKKHTKKTSSKKHKAKKHHSKKHAKKRSSKRNNQKRQKHAKAVKRARALKVKQQKAKAAAKRRKARQIHRTKIQKLTAHSYHLVKSGAKQPLVNFQGNPKNLKLQKVHVAKNRGITWRRVGKTTLIKNKHRTVYYQLVNGNQRVWVPAQYLRKGLVAPSGKVNYQGTYDGVANYAAPHKVLDPIWHEDFKVLSLAGNGSFTTNLKSNDFQRSAAYSKHKMQNTPDTLNSSKSNGANYSFRTSAYLPASYDQHGDMSNPQSAAFSADDRTLYVMYTTSGSENDTASNTGHVVRYDWAALKQLGLSDSGRMAILRRAAMDHLKHRESAFDQTVLSHVHVGPTFSTGHGQSMALNPKNNEIWFTQDMTPGKSVVERLNTNTLQPDARLSFSLKSGVGMGSVLTFDDAGHAYFWKKKTNSSWKNTPTGSVKIYRGTLSTHHVHFSTVLQGLRTAPGYFVQSMSYNPANGRLYLISDESITSLPANRLGHLKASDVNQINFSGHREFEGLIFEHHQNNGYLLVNRGPGLMNLIR